MQKTVKFFLFMLFSIWLVFVSCTKNTIADSGYIYNIEQSFQEELNEAVPDFTSVQVEDPSCYVPGLPERVIWYTSKPKDISSKSTKTGGILRLPIQHYPTSFRFIGPNLDTANVGLFKTNASLVSMNPETNEIMPYGATHWAFSNDGASVYFKLHDRAIWSDGVFVTSDDYEFALKFMLSENLGDETINKAASKLKITKYGDYCVCITCIDPPAIPQSLLETVNLYPRPRHFFGNVIEEGWHEKYNYIPEPTTGPYVFNTNDSIEGSTLTFDRVESWWARSYDHLKNTANISRLEYVVIDGENYETESLAQFYNGSLDTIVYDTDVAWEAATIRENVNLGYITRYIFNYIPSLGPEGIFLNTKSKVFSNKEVRKGLYYCMDIANMIKDVHNSKYIRNHNISFGNIWNNIEFTNARINKPYFLLEQARSIFYKAGYSKPGDDGFLTTKEGEKLTFTLLYSDKLRTAELVFIKNQAKTCGIDMVLEYVEKEALTKRIENNDYDAVFYTQLSSGFPPSNHSDFFSKASSEIKGSNNICQYWSPEMEALLKEEATCTNIHELAEINKRIEELVHNEALLIPYYISQSKKLGAWAWVRFPGWGNRRDLKFDLSPYGYMWIDDIIKTEILTAMQEGKPSKANIVILGERYIQSE